MIAEAIVACERAIALDPHHANAYSNLGALLKLQGRETEAEAAYRPAVELNPEHVGAYVNLGILLAGQHRTREAVACYCKVVTLSPRHPQARRLLAIAHSTIGEIDKAMQIYQEWLDEEPDNPVARHMLAACSGRDVPTRASDDYVAALFDGFAGSFETRLAHLAYQAPQLVARMLEDEAAAGAALDVLDAGCGTGLCGPLIAAHARRLVGIDLSAGMLAHAAEKRVYQELVQGELTAYLRSAPQQFDVIVSADTLVYFGALDEVAAAAAHALRRGGRLIFTLEEWQDAGEVSTASARTAVSNMHGAYVERTLTAAGFEPRIERAELRMEGGAPVPGPGGSRHESRGSVTMARAMEITTPLGEDVLLFHGMHAREELSRLFDYQLDLLSLKNDINLDKILGKNVTVTVALPDDSSRHFNGFVTRFSAGGLFGRYLPLHRDRAPVAVVPDAHHRLPHLPGDDRSGHHQGGVRRSSDGGLQVGADLLVPQVGLLRAVSRDRFQLHQPADGARGHVLLLPPHRRRTTRWC